MISDIQDLKTAIFRFCTKIETFLCCKCKPNVILQLLVVKMAFSLNIRRVCSAPRSRPFSELGHNPKFPHSAIDGISCLNAENDQCSRQILRILHGSHHHGARRTAHGPSCLMLFKTFLLISYANYSNF